MTIPEWKRIARILKEAYTSLQEEALKNGEDIFSEQYKQAVLKVRDTLLAKAGFTLEEYDQVKNQLEAARLAKRNGEDVGLALINEAKAKLEEINKVGIPTKADIVAIATEVAKTFIKPPVVTNITKNEIVKETTVVKELPQIIETTRIVNTPYNDVPLKNEMRELKQELMDVKTAKPSLDNEVLAEELKQFFHDNFSEGFQKNIDILGMPDWRKLAMGLQGQIDELANNTPTGGGHVIQDEGVSLTQRTKLNFVGAGVAVTDDAGNDATKVTINGGGGSGLTKETPTGTINDSNLTFTVSNEPFFINVNGAIYEAGDGIYASYAGGTITLASPVGTGGFIKSYY